MQSTMLKAITEDFGNGGTIDGDLVVSGDLQVSGGGSLSFDEIIEGTSQVKVTNTSAFLVEKADGTDVLIVDTTNSRVGVGIAPTVDLDISSPSGDVQARLFRNANVKTSLTFKNSLQEWEIGNSVGDNNKFTIRDITDSRNAFVIDGSGDTSFSGTATVSGGVLTLGTADSTSGHINAFENMSFNIDTDNDDTNRFFEFAINGSSGAGTELMRLTEAGQLGIGSSAPDAWSYSTKVLTLSGGTTANNYVAFNLGAYSTSTTGIIGDINFTQFASDGTTGAERAIIRGLNDGATDSVALKFYTTATGGAVTERMVINSDGTTTFHYDPTVSSYNGNLTVKSANSSDGDATLILISDAGAANEDTWKINAEGSNNNLDFINHTNTRFSISSSGSSTFTGTVTIDADATDGTALTIDSEAQDGQGIYMDVSQQTTGYGINIADSGNSRTTGGLLYINSNQNNGGTRNLVHIINEHANATGTTALFVKQDAAQEAVKIDQNGNGDGLLIATDATTRHGLYVDGSAFTTGNGAYIYSNASNDSTRNVMLIVNDHTGAIGATGLKIQQDSTAPAMHINAGGNDVMKVDSNSRISLSNNDGGGTGGNASTSANTLLGYGIADMDDGSISNTLIGHRVAGNGSHADMTNNTAVGNLALYYVSSGDNNTAFGSVALHALTTGSNNTAIGYNSLDAGTDAHDNTAIGFASLGSSTSVGYAVAIGREALNNGDVTADADGTVGIGYKALYALTSGANNTAVGNLSSDALTTGSQNTAIGDSALGATVDGASNTAVGAYAMSGGDAHIYNTAIGCQSLSDATGSSNTALGFQSGNTGTNDITSGSENTLIGSQTSASSSTASNQIVIGQGEVGYGDNTASIGGTILGLNVPNTMSSPYYRFDGVDDLINLGSDANLDDIFDNGGSISGWFYPMSDGEDNGGRIIDKAKTIINLANESGGKTLMRLYIVTDGTDGSWATPVQIENEKWTHFAVVYDNSATANNPTMYLNGVSVTVTEESTPNNTRTSDASDSMIIGNNAGGGVTFDGSIAGIQIRNHELTATEVKELYSGASVPFKYKGANQTTLFDSGSDVFTSGTYAWTGYGSNGVANVSNQLAITYSNDASGAFLYLRDSYDLNTDLTVGKRYRFSVDAKYAGGSAGVTLGLNDSVSNFASSALTTSMVRYHMEFTCLHATSTYVRLLGLGASNVVTLDNLSLVQIGAVAEYDGSGIASDKWFDKSGNDLHGAVTGASVENAPSGDDGLVYEDGTWTPLPADASSGGNTASAGTATGYYTRIGRMVHCEFTLVNINTTGMTSGNDFFVQGLPYTVANHAGHAQGSVALENVNFTGEYVTISPSGGTTAIRFAEVPDNGNIDIVMVSEINDDSADIYGHFSYMAT